MKARNLAAILLAALALWLAVGAAAPARAEDAKKEPCIEDEEKYDLAVDEALARLDKARMLDKKNQKKEAADELLKVIEMSFCPGKNEDGFKLKLLSITTCAQIYIDLKKSDDAVGLLKKGIGLAPEVSKEAAALYATLAKAFEQQEKSKEAIEASDKALEILEKLKKKDGDAKSEKKSEEKSGEGGQ